MRTLPPVLALALAVALALTLAACGKKGAPEPVGPREQVTWPKAYPTR